MPRVTVNTDMTSYLPSDSQMREGTDVMEDELGVDDPVSTIRIMVDGLDDDSERSTVHDGLADADGDAAADRAPALEGHVVQWVSDNTSTSSGLPVWIVTLALALLVLVLLVMSASWIEPVLYLVAIGMAVALNMGLVALRPSVSETTYSIAAILQLVLSMDYSIILANRYRQERDAQREAGEDGRSAPVTAMRRALRNSFGAVVSASLTTVVGLLMLVFMSFRIGADLGTVLAQDVAVSLVTVLTVLPGILLARDRLITRTAKPRLRPSLGGLARAEYRFRWAIAAGFVVLLAGSFVLQGRTTTSYTLEREDPVAEVVAKDTQVVLVYDNDDEAAATALGEALAADYPGDDGVRSVTSYGTTIGQQLTKEEAAAALEQQGTADDAGAADAAGGDSQSVLPDGAIDVLWYVGNGGEAGTMTLSELGDVAASLEQDEGEDSESDGAAALSAEDRAGLSSLAALPQAVASGAVDASLLTTPMTPEEMSEALGSLPGADGRTVSADSLELLYLQHAAATRTDPSWTMSTEELLDTASDMAADPSFSGLLDDDATARLDAAREQFEEAKAELVGAEHSRMIVTTGLPEESEATPSFIDDLQARADAELSEQHWLVGQSVMVDEMRDGFPAENLRITLLTAGAIFLIVALTLRSAAVPALLVLLVQCGVFVTVSVSGITGADMYYLAMLVVQCILMGATIDYAIVITTYYRQHRRTEPVARALAGAYEGSIHTILTSCLIMILATGVLGYLFENPTVGQICLTIAIGATAAVLLILLVLPALLAVTDRWIVPARDRYEEPTAAEPGEA